jgi:hypothetical protein
MPKTEVVRTYKASITAKKYAIQLAILLIITTATYAIDVLIPGLSIDYPQYAGILVVLVPLIEAFRNWLKHRYDTEEVEVQP